MFTGIIENFGTIKDISLNNSNRTFFIESELSAQLREEESVSHNGICLTVERIQDNHYRVTTVAETIKKTNAGHWKIGDKLNLERAMLFNARLDGHIVQGHVDDVAVCTSRKDMNGSTEFTFEYDSHFAPLMIEKGSVCLNGVSLTAFAVTENQFTVAIIPYTMSHTNFSDLQVGDAVNIEYDVLGKYVQRNLLLKK